MSKFNQLRTFIDRGIEYMKVNNRPYRIYRVKAKEETQQMYLLPIVSVEEELAKDKRKPQNNQL